MKQNSKDTALWKHSQNCVKNLISKETIKAFRILTFPLNCSSIHQTLSGYSPTGIQMSRGNWDYWPPLSTKLFHLLQSFSFTGFCRSAVLFLFPRMQCALRKSYDRIIKLRDEMAVHLVQWRIVLSPQRGTIPHFTSVQEISVIQAYFLLFRAWTERRWEEELGIFFLFVLHV